MWKSETKFNTERQAAHQHNHQLRGDACPLPAQSWPWQPDDCPVLVLINRLMPWAEPEAA